jgi:hypothetical protein
VAIGAAMSDRARLIKHGRSTERVEGRFLPTGPTPGPWFRCYYDPGTESEARSTGGVRRSHPATLMFKLRAMDGTLVEATAKDEVEIQSRRFGTIRMEIMGTPEPIAKRTSRIGWIAALQKVSRSAPG